MTASETSGLQDPAEPNPCRWSPSLALLTSSREAPAQRTSRSGAGPAPLLGPTGDRLLLPGQLVAASRSLTGRMPAPGCPAAGLSAELLVFSLTIYRGSLRSADFDTCRLQ